METVSQKTVVLSDSALKECLRLLQSEDNSGTKGLRIAVKGGGCAGFTYEMSFDSAQDDDIVIPHDGLDVLVKQIHAIYLQGTEIDYAAGLNNRGFVYNNPNADTTCGCGSSFG